MCCPRSKRCVCTYCGYYGGYPCAPVRGWKDGATFSTTSGRCETMRYILDNNMESEVDDCHEVYRDQPPSAPEC